MEIGTVIFICDILFMSVGFGHPWALMERSQSERSTSPRATCHDLVQVVGQLCHMLLEGALDHLQALLLSFLPVSVGDRCSLVPTLSALLPGWAHARVEHSAVALEPFDFVLTIWVALALDEEPTQ
jgi:hypothetical protein